MSPIPSIALLAQKPIEQAERRLVVAEATSGGPFLREKCLHGGPSALWKPVHRNVIGPPPRPRGRRRARSRPRPCCTSRSRRGSRGRHSRQSPSTTNRPNEPLHTGVAKRVGAQARSRSASLVQIVRSPK